MMETLCAHCGVYDSYYQCDLCNKKFCIDDWDKVHQNISHQKQRIVFQVNEDSRQVLINFFEKLKSENLKNYKEKIIEISHNNAEINIADYYDINITSYFMISYLCRIKYVNKKLLYFPLDYYLINLPAVSKRYVNIFNFSNYKGDYKQLLWLLFINYIWFEKGFIYGLEYAQYKINPILSYLLIGYLMEYLNSYNYKSALELLNNIDELPPFFIFELSESRIEIKAFKYYITHLLDEDSNVDLDLWNQAAKVVNDKDNLWLTELFYRNFEIIFWALNNWKYCKICMKCLIKDFGRNRCFIKLNDIYFDFAKFYIVKGSRKKSKDYLIKAYKVLAKNSYAMVTDSNMLSQSIYKTLIALSKHYEGVDQAKQNKFFGKCKYYFKKFKNISTMYRICSLLFLGHICFYTKKLKESWHYLQKCANKIRKKKIKIDLYLSDISYHQGYILYKNGDLEKAIQKIYKAKEIEKIIFKDSCNLLL